MSAGGWAHPIARAWAISHELGIDVITLYKWRKAWLLQGDVVPASQKDPEGWGPTDKFTVVLVTAGLNVTELSG